MTSSPSRREKKTEEPWVTHPTTLPLSAWHMAPSTRACSKSAMDVFFGTSDIWCEAPREAERAQLEEGPVVSDCDVLVTFTWKGPNMQVAQQVSGRKI